VRAALMDVLVPSLYSGPRRPFVGARAAARARHLGTRVPVQSRVRTPVRWAHGRRRVSCREKPTSLCI
jgi:hypothetical protein